jgi:CHAT domain-containing protein
LIELDLQKIQEAKRYARLGYSADLKAFSQILSFGSEQQRLAYARQLFPYSLFARLGESDALLAEAVLHYKGVVLDSLIEDRLLAETSKDEDNRKLVEEYKAEKQSLAQLILGPTIDSSDEVTQRIPELEREVANIEGKLARYTVDLGRARRALTVTVGQVQRAIPSNTVLIEYVKYPSLEEPKLSGHLEGRYGAVVFSSTAPPRWVSLGGSWKIEEALARYKRVVREGKDDDEMVLVLQQLHSQLWEPIERVFSESVSSVVVSPDAHLNFLSFATLLDRDKHFVAEKYSIRYVTSGRDLLRDFKVTQNKSVVVLANPNFDEELGLNAGLAKSEPSVESTAMLRDMRKREIEDLTFTELPGTRKESDQLLSQFRQWNWPAKSLTAEQATKQALLALRSPYILHVATHGFFEPEDASSEGVDPNKMLLLGAQSSVTKSRFFENPMHRSGLALAGANSTIELGYVAKRLT